MSTKRRKTKQLTWSSKRAQHRKGQASGKLVSRAYSNIRG